MKKKKNNMLRKFDPEEAISVFFDDADINPGKVIIELTDETITAGSRVLLQNVNLKVLGRDKICIIGENGCGKTTLIRYLWKKLKDRKDLRAGYVPQNYREVMDHDLTVVEYLSLSERKKDREKILTMLGAMKFTGEEMNHRIEDLSEGQKCKILLTRLIVNKCNVLLLDEVTRNLSPLSNPQIRKILADFGGCIISISHDRKYIDEVADKILVLKDKQLQELF